MLRSLSLSLFSLSLPLSLSLSSLALALSLYIYIYMRSPPPVPAQTSSPMLKNKHSIRKREHLTNNKKKHSRFGARERTGPGAGLPSLH